jgi:hypothetical protein
MFLLSVKMTSSSILEMQRCEWPETLLYGTTYLFAKIALPGQKFSDKQHFPSVSGENGTKKCHDP